MDEHQADPEPEKKPEGESHGAPEAASDNDLVLTDSSPSTHAPVPAAAPAGPKEATWADDPAFRNKLWYGYLVICAVLIGGDLAGLAAHHVEGEHAAAGHGLADFPGFYGIAGGEPFADLEPLIGLVD